MRNRRFIYALMILFILVAGTACSGKKESKEQKVSNVNQQSAAEGTNVADTKEEDSLPEGIKADTTMLSVNDVKVPYNEVMLYVLLLKEMYEPSLTNIIWDYKLDTGVTFGEMAKQEVLNQIIQLKVMSEQAKKLNVTLADDELMEVENYANDYLKGITNEDQEKYGITYDTVFQICKDNYLADKVFNVATMDVDTMISDDEAKQVTVWQIEVSTIKTDEAGKETALSDDEKKTAYKKAKKLLKSAKKAEDFYSFAMSNSDDSVVEYTFGKDDKSAPYVEAAFSLEEGKISKVVETDTGYYILYMVDSFNEDATAAKKETIINQRQDEAFQKMYKEWLSDYKVKVKESNWKKIAFQA
ncbi:MAG TPA: peptidylprolyl isomerase [Lachnospiraceae bacterium]|nr:peptidylprolyl isomerase [Lachnospiraceae bacterium]